MQARAKFLRTFLGLCSILAVSIFTSLMPVAASTNSPVTCSNTPKYWCNFITYDGTTIDFRWYEGSRGCDPVSGTCGYDKWRLDYACDDPNDGTGNYPVAECFGPGDYDTNRERTGNYRNMGPQRSYSADLYVEMNETFWNCGTGGCLSQSQEPNVSFSHAG